MQFKFRNNYILTVCVLILTAILIISITRPNSIDSEQKAREKTVIRYLTRIRQAEEDYLQQHGNYTADFSELISHNLLPDSMQYIPYSDSTRFDLDATSFVTKSGQQKPLVQCAAPYEEYLKGMDANHIADLIQQANASGQYPGLKFGSLDQPNNNAGNWE